MRRDDRRCTRCFGVDPLSLERTLHSRIDAGRLDLDSENAIQ